MAFPGPSVGGPRRMWSRRSRPWRRPLGEPLPSPGPIVRVRSERVGDSVPRRGCPMTPVGGEVSEAPTPLLSPPSMTEHVAAAGSDLLRGFTDWRMWLLLGMNDIRQRYQRSRIGQFWIT